MACADYCRSSKDRAAELCLFVSIRIRSICYLWKAHTPAGRGTHEVSRPAYSSSRRFNRLYHARAMILVLQGVPVLNTRETNYGYSKAVAMIDITGNSKTYWIQRPPLLTLLDFGSPSPSMPSDPRRPQTLRPFLVSRTELDVFGECFRREFEQSLTFKRIGWRIKIGRENGKDI